MGVSAWFNASICTICNQNAELCFENTSCWDVPSEVILWFIYTDVGFHQNSDCVKRKILVLFNGSLPTSMTDCSSAWHTFTCPLSASLNGCEAPFNRMDWLFCGGESTPRNPISYSKDSWNILEKGGLSHDRNPTPLLCEEMWSKIPEVTGASLRVPVSQMIYTSGVCGSVELAISL